MSTDYFGGTIEGPGGATIVSDEAGDHIVFHGVKTSGGFHRPMYVSDLTWKDGRPIVARSCHSACQGFSQVQGANNWRYQDKIHGNWQDIKTITPTGYLNMRQWHDDNPTGGYVWSSVQHPGPANDTARTWTAPKNGVIDIVSHPAKLLPSGNGVTVQITRNGSLLWGPAVIAGTDTVGIEANVPKVVVKAGDLIRFEIGNNGDWANDVTTWDPDIIQRGRSDDASSCHTACQGFSNVQGANGWRYQDKVGGYWQDIKTFAPTGYFNLRQQWHDDNPAGGYVWPSVQHPGPANDTARTWTAPKNGTIDIISNAAKLLRNGNGVTVQITRNGSVLWGPAVISGDDTVGTEANLRDVKVTAGDLIRFEIGNNGDWVDDATTWDPDIIQRG